MKRKFAPTMEFVEEYLRDVVSQPFPFGDKDKNELTLEVKSKIFQICSLFFCLKDASSLVCFTPPLQVVNLARNLVYFGFYSFSELLRLTRTLLAILDIVQHPLSFISKLNKSPEAGQCSYTIYKLVHHFSTSQL